MASGEHRARDGTGARIVVSAAAATRLAEARAWLDARSPATELLVIGASWDACDELVRAASRDDGCRFGTTRLTLGALAGVLATPALAAAGSVPAGALSLDAIAARAVHRLADEQALGYFTPVVHCPGFPRAVARTIEELRMHGLAPGALGGVPDVGTAMAALIAAVEDEIRRAGVADRAAVFAAARDAVGHTSSPLVGVPLLLLDVPLRSTLEAELVRALAMRAPAVLATAAAGDARSLSALEGVLGVAREALRERAGHSLANLQTHLFEDTSPSEHALDDRVELRSWPGEARECVEIARRIHAEAAGGVAFDRMAIFLPAPRDYTPHLEEALRRAEIPAFFATGTTRPDAAGRALLALLACAADGLSARRFAEYVSLAQVPQPDVQRERAAAPDRVWVAPDHDLVPPALADALPAALAGAADDPLPADPERVPIVAGTLRAPWRWEQLLVDASVIGQRERWQRRLAGLEEELRMRRLALAADDEGRVQRVERELADLAHLRAFALPLIERLASLPARATWGVWLEHLRALAAVSLRDPERVLSVLAELAPMAPVGPIDLDEVRLVLTERLRDLRERSARRRYGAVFVGCAPDARGCAFDVVFVAGLAERIFPRKITEDPILLDESRRVLSAGLTTQPDRVADERLALRLAIGAARERVVLSYPRLDTQQGRPRVPSFYTLEALRAAEGRLPSFEEIAGRARGDDGVRLGWPAPARPEDAIDDAEYDLALLAPLLDADPETTRGTARYLLGANVHLARALRARARRWWRSQWTYADGLVDADELGRAALARHQLSARSFSPTALQNFATCPYRFFLQAVHRLQPREEPIAIETLDPMTRGALFHDVQYALLTKLRADGRLPVRPDNCEAAQDTVDDVLRSVAAAYGERLAPAIPRVWDDAIASIRADLREWLRLAAADDGCWVPHRFELSFGIADRDRANADAASSPDPVPLEGGLRLRGAIDLVERHVRGRLRVTDHKTGKVRAKAGVVVGGGEILQPILYALACERLLPEPVAAGRLYYCTATGGYEERIVPLDDGSRAAARTVIEVLDRALQTGFLPAAPVARACDYCDYRPVCGPYEEIRTKRKPQDRLHDLARLRSMP